MLEGVSDHYKARVIDTNQDAATLLGSWWLRDEHQGLVASSPLLHHGVLDAVCRAVCGDACVPNGLQRGCHPLIVGTDAGIKTHRAFSDYSKFDTG